jgi:L-alanine-DL-glutamate epimerase-like enolase superfamily enzyme
MEIARITVYQADLPVPGGAYHMSGGRAYPALDTTLVKIETDKGLTGWGESCPFGPVYLPAHALGVRSGIAELAPHLIGRDPTAVERINEVMDAALPGHFHAKSALDLGWRPT